jgi:hypothetical protein
LLFIVAEVIPFDDIVDSILLTDDPLGSDDALIPDLRGIR